MGFFNNLIFFTIIGLQLLSCSFKKDFSDKIQILWKKKVGSGIPYLSSAAISKGIIYYGIDSVLYAVDANSGKIKWKYRTENGDILSAPLLFNGTIYIGSRNKNLYSINAKKGSINWIFKTSGEISATPILYEDNLLFGSSDSFFYSLKISSGKLNWKTKLIDQTYLGPSCSQGIACVPCPYNLYTLDCKNGKILLKIDFDKRESNMLSSPVVAENDKIYVNTWLLLFSAFDLHSGKELWTKPTTYGVYLNAPKIDGNTILNARSSGDLITFDKNTGDEIWRFKARSEVYPPIIINNILYFGSRDSCFYAVDKTKRKELWHYKMSTSIKTSAVYENGIICFGGNDSCVYAIKLKK